MPQSSKMKIIAPIFIIVVIVIGVSVYWFSYEIRESEAKLNYLKQIEGILSTASQIRGEFKDVAVSEKASKTYVSNKCSGYASTFEYLLEKAKKLEPPQEYYQSHMHLVKYLELNARGFDLLAEGFSTSDTTLVEKGLKYLMNADEELRLVLQETP